MSESVRLTTAQMAQFVARGFVELTAVIPDDLNAAATDELGQIMKTWGSPARPFAPSSGQPLDEIYPEPSAVGAVLRHPTVRGAIESLVGGDCVFDHDFVHFKPAHDTSSQHLHADAIVDPNLAFDIQLFYFPHAVEPGAGGTGYVPGTHLRVVNEMDVGRYLNIAGQEQWHGPAGTVVIFHHGMWHRGQSNHSDTDRLMYKIRLNPTSPQVRLWDTSDYDALDSGSNDHIFATFRFDSIAGMLRAREPWMGEPDYRLELVKRARLWRYLSGDDGFDVDWYLTRQAGRQPLADGAS